MSRGRSEAEWKRDLVDEFKAGGHYARRIEDQYTVGFPDLILILKDEPVIFAEAKLIYGDKFGPTDRQFVELKRLSISKFSVPLCIGWKTNLLHIHPYAQVCYMKDCFIQKQSESMVAAFRRYLKENVNVG